MQNHNAYYPWGLSLVSPGYRQDCGRQPSVPRRNAATVYAAASSAVNCGRSADATAPGPRLWCSPKRASRHGQVPKSDQAVAPMCDPIQESRMIAWPIAFGSLLGCHGRPRKTVPAGASEVWQARIGRDLAEQLRADAEVLGLDGRTDIVKAALALLHRQAAEERMARSVADFYGDAMPPLPLGVEPADDGA